MGTDAQIITACQQTIFGYAHSRDAVALDENAALFTEDATLRIRDTLLSGKAEIKASLAERGPKQGTRHLMTSVSIDIDASKNVSGKSYALIYAGALKSSRSKSSPQDLGADGPLTLKYILTYKDDFEVVGMKCLIKHRHIIIENVEN